MGNTLSPQWNEIKNNIQIARENNACNKVIRTLMLFYESQNLQRFLEVCRGQKHWICGIMPAIFDKYAHVLNNGKAVSYFYNNKKEYEITYHNGFWHGKYIQYYPNGRVFIQATYVNGRLHGMYIERYSNGKIRLIKRYEQDKAQGLCRMYRENGIIESSFSYKCGYLHGDYVRYDTRGHSIFKYTYV